MRYYQNMPCSCLWLVNLQSTTYYLIDSQQQNMLAQLLTKSIANLTKPPKQRSLKQRLKHYAHFPNKFRLITRIRPPNLSGSNIDGITFPIRIPIRYRHKFELKRQLTVDNSTKIHWNRLEPNQILLGFENIQYLTFKEIVQGLRYLSQIKGQQQHDWNKHQWVVQGLNKVRDEFARIKKVDIMNFYYLMKKLNYADKDFWKKVYARIEENIYDLYPRQFEYIYMTYYDTAAEHFSPEAQQKFSKLMEGRLREFSPEGIIFVLEQFIRDKKVDNYWLENVFISLFKDKQYIYNAPQLTRIFRAMMLLDHEVNDRLYDSLYRRVRECEYRSEEEVDKMEETMLEVKEIFVSHRIEPVLEFLKQKREEVKELKAKQSIKTIEQMVRDDLKYFLEKRRLKSQEKGTQTETAPA